jgi:hypothetical protein
MQRILGTVEPAGEQHLLDQRVELGDVAVDLGLELVALRRRGAVEHRHRHLHPRQRRAQLVAGVGEQRPVRLHQASTRCAATLKLEATAATSSLPLTSTRWLSWPAPNCSTPCFSASSRRVSRRTTG